MGVRLALSPMVFSKRLIPQTKRSPNHSNQQHTKMRTFVLLSLIAYAAAGAVELDASNFESEALEVRL